MIIAIKEKDRVVVGYTNSDEWKMSASTCVDEENVAMKYTKDGTLLGFARMDRGSDILKYDEGLENIEITPQSVVRDVIPQIKKALEKGGKKLDKEKNWENTLTICLQNRIFDVSPRFYFREVEEFVCHGYATETLQSVLDETSHLPAEERIIKALTFAGELDHNDYFPVTITDTKTKQFKSIYKGDKQ